jgi:predicted nucleotidyltransferase
MQREEVLKILRDHRADLDALGVRHLSLFGSVARGDAGPESDVDVLVEFDGRTTFDRYMDLVLALQDWLGRRVDVVTQRSLARKPDWQKRIAAEALLVA